MVRLRFGWYIRGPHFGPVHSYWAPERRSGRTTGSVPAAPPAPRRPAGQVWYSRPQTAPTPKGWWVYAAVTAIVTALAASWTVWAAVPVAAVFVALAVLVGIGQRKANRTAQR